MIYLFTALYCEAHIFIRHFRLAKNPENTWFQEFYNEAAGIRLTVTGVGEIAAAAAVGAICASYQPSREDVLLNVGLCAHTAGRDGIYLCNRITEWTTGKTFYPDILYRHDFREAAIMTGMNPWDGEEGGKDGGEKGRGEKDGGEGAEMISDIPADALYDMEAAAIYQAGSRFFGPHQMMFLKVVSDNGAAKEVSEKQAEHLMETYRERIMDYIGQLHEITHTDEDRENHMRQEEEALLKKLCADLHCSKAMSDSVRQYLRYLTLEGREYDSAIRDMYEKELLPCKDKREGKLRFEELKRRLF